MFTSKVMRVQPHMYHLEHVQKRVEHCVSLMFRDKLDFSFYRKDVILEDQIMRVRKVGLDSYINHLSGVSLITNLLLPYAELRALNIIPLLDDGTVRLRWRVCYQGWLTALSWRNFMHKVDFESSLKWYDGYSIFYVDGDGKVAKVTIQKVMPNSGPTQIQRKKDVFSFDNKCMPNDDKTLSPKKIAQKFVQNTQSATNSATAVKKP
ncbi:Protein of unknown function DUF2358 family-containing protein [Aphelenchoides bicaudatus]|nr:Protein of unknown function DUF2358 family-containing protein [Aphelenchoides bicaudatus]